MSPSDARQSLWTGPRGAPRRYRVDLRDGVLQQEGDGGEGLVYRATGTIDGAERDVALKLLTTLSVEDYERVAVRARLMGEIDHPHVMHQVETFVGTALIDTDDPADDEFDVVYTVADWVPGASLAVAVEAAGPVAGLRWVAQIARAVAYLHAFRSPDAPDGVIHRDIKPSNVRIFQDQAVLIDFGVARPHDTSAKTQGVGTYLWRAPESIGGPGQPGPASDAWGVGALGYWVLVGEPPRLEGAAAARERLVAVAREQRFPSPTDLGQHLAQLLETHPDDRPADLERWADRLDDLTASARRPRRSTPAARPGKRRRLGVGVGAAGVLLAALAVGAAALADDSGGQKPRRHTEPSTTLGPTTVPTTTVPPTTTTIPGSVALSVLTGIEPLALRDGPSVGATQLGAIPPGTPISVECYVPGETVVGLNGFDDVYWDRVSYDGQRGYVTDAFVDTGNRNVDEIALRCTS